MVETEVKNYLILALTLLLFLTNPVFAQEQKSGEQDPLQHFQSMGKTNAQILAILGQADKPGFLYFTTDWCGACEGLEKETFADPAFGLYLQAHFIPFLINAEKNTGPDLNDLYHIGAYPTVVILSPQGVVIDKITGYDKPEPYFKKLKDVVNGIDTLARLKSDYESDPGKETKAVALANRYLSSYDYTSAKPILEKLLLTSPNLKETPDFLFGLSQYYFNLQSSQAALFFERIVKEFPYYSDIELVYRELGRVYADIDKEPRKRIDLFENGIRKGALKGYLANARFVEAVDSVALKEWNNALAYLEKATGYAPGTPWVPLLRSYCFMQIGRETEGRALLDKLYSETNVNQKKRLELMAVCGELKIYLKEALAWLEPIVAQDGGKTNQILYGYGRLLALNGEKQKGLGIMERAEAATPEGQIRMRMKKQIDELRREMEKK
jgi:thioredoxin-related protein